jgi:glycosyltransferase involved in cell wall biosynthesis
MPALVASCSVVLFPPRTLAGKADVPLTVLEGLATGRPVLTTDLPHFASLGPAVVRVPVDQPLTGGRALAELLADLPAAAAGAAQRRAAAEAAFSPRAMAQAYAELYDELLSRSARARR